MLTRLRLLRVSRAGEIAVELNAEQDLDLATRGMGKMRAGDKVDHNSPFLNLLACIPKSQGFTEFPAIPFQALYAP